MAERAGKQKAEREQQMRQGTQGRKQKAEQQKGVKSGIQGDAGLVCSMPFIKVTPTLLRVLLVISITNKTMQEGRKESSGE